MSQPLLHIYTQLPAVQHVVCNSATVENDFASSMEKLEKVGLLILQASQFTILITADTDVFTQESVSLITKKRKG